MFVIFRFLAFLQAQIAILPEWTMPQKTTRNRKQIQGGQNNEKSSHYGIGSGQ